MKRSLRMKIALAILYGEPGSDIPSKFLRKCKSKLERSFLGHYEDKIFIPL